MERLPDHYENLGVDRKATAEAIERTYQKRCAELRVSRVEDAPEEMAEVEAAYAVLRDPQARAKHDEQLSEEERKLDSRYAELDKLTSDGRHHVRRFNKGSSGWLDLLWAFFEWLK